MLENRYSLAVSDPEIPEVQSTETGEIYPAADVIGNDYGYAMGLRMSLRQSIAEGAPRLVCPMCGVPVYLVSLKESRRFFFRHELEDGRCPAHTRGALSEDEINARKYNGAKESRAHIRMKAIVEESLRCYPRFSNILIEAVWKGQDRASWRKPDVQATYNGIPVAFEIQLSTTFLRVIAERRAFYLQEGGLLVWIFKSFKEDSARLTQDDIFYSNNRNLFLATEDTLNASRAAGKLVLDCHWAVPFLEGGKVRSRWSGRFVAFDELTIDRRLQRAFLYDYDSAEQALQGTSQDEALRLEFEAFWLHLDAHGPHNKSAWLSLRSGFADRGIFLPVEPRARKGPAFLLNALYSAREGRPVGWRFKKLIEVAHRIAGGHKDLLRSFRHALAVYGRAEQIVAEDREGKWRRKVEAYRPLLMANHPDYAPDQRYDPLVRLLFPEMGHTQE